MAARNNFQARSGQLPGEASRREILFSFASVIVVSAFIYAVTLSVMRLPV